MHQVVFAGMANKFLCHLHHPTAATKCTNGWKNEPPTLITFMTQQISSGVTALLTSLKLLVPTLMALIKVKFAILSTISVHMFVDATFDIVPHPFYQCLIIMVFDARLRIFIPVAWILMTGKTNECYWQAFNWLCSAVDEIAPAYIGVDFERAFFTQVSNHFSEADLIGCLFHFKQALRRKMIKLGIPEEESYLLSI
eukprot:CCRYP_008952-RG/>CCRYP_008952-RG protein AED:0.38 eAED:0.62 QI:0/0/0/1/0/0.33/3/0/196